MRLLVGGLSWFAFVVVVGAVMRPTESRSDVQRPKATQRQTEVAGPFTRLDNLPHQELNLVRHASELMPLSFKLSYVHDFKFHSDDPIFESCKTQEQLSRLTRAQVHIVGEFHLGENTRAFQTRQQLVDHFRRSPNRDTVLLLEGAVKGQADGVRVNYLEPMGISEALTNPSIDGLESDAPWALSQLIPAYLEPFTGGVADLTQRVINPIATFASAISYSRQALTGIDLNRSSQLGAELLRAYELRSKEQSRIAPLNSPLKSSTVSVADTAGNRRAAVTIISALYPRVVSSVLQGIRNGRTEGPRNLVAKELIQEFLALAPRGELADSPQLWLTAIMWRDIEFARNIVEQICVHRRAKVWALMGNMHVYAVERLLRTGLSEPQQRPEVFMRRPKASAASIPIQLLAVSIHNASNLDPQVFLKTH